MPTQIVWPHAAWPRCTGKLMGQLHDRNCRRAFAPAEAFQADALPAERFQSEMQVGGGAGADDIQSCLCIGQPTA